MTRGGLVIIEADHSDKPDFVVEYRSNELPKVFEGFRILNYEEAVGTLE